MSVHHIDMNPISSGLLRFGHLLTEACEVGGKNRRSEFDGMALHLGKSSL
jgi:hypothetical protein